MKVSYYTKLSGTSFRQDAIKNIKAGTTPLRAVAEPDNEYDKYAVRVEALTDEGWTQIGYFQKGKNQNISEALQEGKTVKVGCSEVTGVDKDTMGVNVSVEYEEDDSGIDPADMRDMEKQKVVFGDDDYVYFDTVNHKAYDKNGHELLSGSRAEKIFAPEFDPKYPAKAVAKSTGVAFDDVISIWENNRDLSSSYGTLIHEALEKYLLYAPVLRKIDANKEREHTATNWMPNALGEIVDKFVATSGIKDCKNVEVRIKHGTRTGIVDLLLVDGDEFTLMDYKIMPEVKEVKYKAFGKNTKYTVQQNYYREILEDCGLKCRGMYLWNWDGKEWKKIELKKVNVKEEL